MAFWTFPETVIAVEDSTSTDCALFEPPGSKLTAAMAFAALLIVMELAAKLGSVNDSVSVVTGPLNVTWS